jgi:hypothetical protein
MAYILFCDTALMGKISGYRSQIRRKAICTVTNPSSNPSTKVLILSERIEWIIRIQSLNIGRALHFLIG